MSEKKNEIVIFETEDRSISLPVAVENETVWLNRNQMAELFERDVKTIGKHINYALKEELSGAIKWGNFSCRKICDNCEGKKRIEDAALVALTIMIAESRPEEKEMMISVVMNCMA